MGHILHPSMVIIENHKILFLRINILELMYMLLEENG
jgi:hypothetical protein